MATPLFSVVIPTFNRRGTLEVALEAWERQEADGLTFEVVVIDDGSTDGTAEMLANRRGERFRLRAMSQSNAGPASARNLAIQIASGDIVLFSGDDIEPHPRLLAEHAAGHEESDDPFIAILGLTRWPDGYEQTATMRHIDGVGAQQFSYHYFSDGSEYDFRHFYTSNVSLRRSLLEFEPDGFCTDFPAAAFEDAEFAYRLAGHGMRIRYRAAAVAYHHHRYEVDAFFDRQARCGGMAAVLIRKQPALKKWLGATPLEWRRLEVMERTVLSRDEARVAADLRSWERRALNLAGFFDRPAPEAVDALLYPLFEYGYAAGLSDALFDFDCSRMVKTAEFLRLVPQGVRELERRAALAGIPVPRSDAAPLAGLGLS